MENKNTEAAMVMAFGLLAHHCGANRGELIKDIQVLIQDPNTTEQVREILRHFLKALGFDSPGPQWFRGIIKGGKEES